MNSHPAGDVGSLAARRIKSRRGEVLAWSKQKKAFYAERRYSTRTRVGIVRGKHQRAVPPWVSGKTVGPFVFPYRGLEFQRCALVNACQPHSRPLSRHGIGIRWPVSYRHSKAIIPQGTVFRTSVGIAVLHCIAISNSRSSFPSPFLHRGHCS